MYSISEFGWMIRDERRMQAYDQALRAAVKPGCVVLDLGCGAGIFALLACKYGAGKVYAIEPNDSIILARKFADANGYSDRIEFIQALSQDVSLSEKADVIVADLRGMLPLYDGNIESMIDARDRFLAPGGRLIPLKDTMYAAVFSSEASYREVEFPWLKNDYDLDLTAGFSFVTNSWIKKMTPDFQLCSNARVWGEIHYPSASETSLKGQVKLDIQSDGIAHGISIWFDAEIAEGFGFSCSPEQERLVYGSAQLAWPKPVYLYSGDKVLLTIEARKMSGEYVWRWESDLYCAPNIETPLESFRQSSFLGKLISPQHLKKYAKDHMPDINLMGLVEARALKLMNGKHSLGEIALELSRSFPEHYADPQTALDYISELSGRFSK